MAALRRAGVVAFALTLVLGAAWATKSAARFNTRPYLYSNLYLPSGTLVAQASLGYKELVADIVWFNAVQYYGGYRQAHHDLAYFAGLIDIVTDLDPGFVFPYRFGAVVMSQDMDAFDNAVALLRKGMVQNPDRWEFPFELGFLSYIDQQDPVMAGRYFELAAKCPGGGDRARRFAAFVYGRAGHEHNSMRMWEEMLETSDEPFMRELAEFYLEKLKRQREAARSDA